MKKSKEIPVFKNEDEERTFWSSNDSTDYIDWDRAELETLSKLKPSTKTISLRLPVAMLDELRVIANKRDVPYQSLIKMIIQEHLDQKRRSTTATWRAIIRHVDPLWSNRSLLLIPTPTAHIAYCSHAELLPKLVLSSSQEENSIHGECQEALVSF